MVSIPNGMEFYLDIFTLSRHSTNVSIPNGMEFYKVGNRECPGKNVSIPNGMEFYACHKHSHKSRHGFQFPTGWNSTPRRQSKPQQRHRFNSQRDGILLDSVFRLFYICRFQFPTGWNSTLILLFL